ncbi:MAG: tRNA-(ms[2]io[6]A)-hydroxylase, partial [Lysobacterales bacterium]
MISTAPRARRQPRRLVSVCSKSGSSWQGMTTTTVSSGCAGAAANPGKHFCFDRYARSTSISCRRSAIYIPQDYCNYLPIIWQPFGDYFARLCPRIRPHANFETMARRSIDLLVATHPDWVQVVLADFDAFIQDHANCERKASALAMSLVVKYPDRTRIVPALIVLAQEELEHFRQVHALMVSRGLALVKDTQDPYVNQLAACMRHGRELRFIDRLLVSSLIECRGAERFRIIADALEDQSLKNFYASLWKAEAKHG